MLNQKAPDFSLTASTGRLVSLRDFAGSYLVLVFYPANETPVCNAQLTDMNMNNEEFAKHNAKILGVNTASATKHKGYCERRNFTFPILSDPGCAVAKSYGASYRWLPMVINRTVVAIDPDGVICFYQHGKPDPQAVLQAIKDRAASRDIAR